MDPIIVEAVIAPAFLLVGLSHLLQPRLWVEFFELLRATGLAAAIIPMYTLPVSLVLIVGHNVWVWDWPVVLTVAGWMMTLKCAIYLILPGAADRMLRKQMAKSPRSFQIVGAIMAVVGAVLTWQSWRGT
jgi:hypothetical protein